MDTPLFAVAVMMTVAVIISGVASLLPGKQPWSRSMLYLSAVCLCVTAYLLAIA